MDMHRAAESFNAEMKAKREAEAGKPTKKDNLISGYREIDAKQLATGGDDLSKDELSLDAGGDWWKKRDAQTKKPGSKPATGEIRRAA